MFIPQEIIPQGDSPLKEWAIRIFLKFIYDPIAWLTAALITVNFFYLWFNRRTVKILEQQYLDSIEPIIFLNMEPLQINGLTFRAEIVIECSKDAAPAVFVGGNLYLISNNGTRLWSSELGGYTSHLNPGATIAQTISGTAQRPVDLDGAEIEGYFWYRDARELQEFYRHQNRDGTFIIIPQHIRTSITWSRRIKTFANKWSRRIKTFANKWSRRN